MSSLRAFASLRLCVSNRAVFRFAVTLLSSLLVTSTSARADVFVYTDQEGNDQEVNARLYGEGQGAMALELADGSLKLVPQAAVSKRTPGDDPVPQTPEEALKTLQSEFRADEFRGMVSGQYVIGVALMEPLPRTSVRRADANLRQAAKYMASIERSFQNFCKKMKVPYEKPKFPLVVLIFETDDEFEEYTTKQTGGQGLSAGNIAGFYSPLTNRLYVRMSECFDFATPLHEAIHQQCFNTGVLSRLAPIPVWFAEGIATGFEGTGDEVRTDPQQLNITYTRLLIANNGNLPRSMTWQDIVTEDGMFRGDIFAGDAYVHAWGMHWLLVTQFPKQYAAYLQYLQTLPPLSEVTPADRIAKFEEHFESAAGAAQTKFVPAFSEMLQKTRLPKELNDEPGVISRMTNLAYVDVAAETNGFSLSLNGRLRNLSPLRDMAFYVVVMTDTGQYAEWLLPKMKINELTRLEPKVINGGGRGFTVRVISTPADSTEAVRWSQGDVPRDRIFQAR